MKKSQSHLIQRHKTWYARLSIPKDVKSKLGHKREFIKTLKTTDLDVAIIRSKSILADWQNLINMARGNASAIESTAIKLHLDDSDASERINTDTGMSDKDYYAEEIAESLDDNDLKVFYDHLNGRIGTPFTYFANDFIEYNYKNPKTAKDALSTLKMFSYICPTLEEVKKSKVLKWLESETRAKKTVSKAKSYLGKYWKYLQMKEVVSLDLEPFYNIDLPKKLKDEEPRESYIDKEIKEIIKHIKKSGDDALLCSCLIAIYTGARISEIGQLTKDDVVMENNTSCLRVNKSKTKAGIRVIPIHPNLTKLISSLLNDKSSEYLIYGIETKRDSKYRGDIISKRFSRIVRKPLNLPKSKVFHSFRNTVTTKLESAGVPENITADIIGHDKDAMTYGLYSGGTSIKQRYGAIKKISYHL